MTIFDPPGGAQVRFSSGAFRRNDGSLIEGVDSAPALPVTWTVEAFRQGQDPDLAAAEALLLTLSE